MPERVSDLKDLEDLGQGRLAVKVYDENGDKKDHLEYRRVKGDGSVEVRNTDGSSQDVGVHSINESAKESWSKERRDKLPWMRKRLGRLDNKNDIDDVGD